MKRLLTPGQAKGWLTGKQICRRGPEGPGGQQVEHESSVCLRNGEAQLLLS